MNTLTFTGSLVTTNCWCGLHHAVPKDLFDYMKAQHNNGEKQMGIYCPLGHSWIFSGKGEAQRLREENERLSRVAASKQHSIEILRDERDTAKRRAAAAKGQLTKMRNRIAKGVCPACNRYFPALHQHVATQHPDFTLPEGVTLDGA